MMKAMILRHSQSSSDFEKLNIPKPRYSSHEVLVKISAASINPVNSSSKGDLQMDFAGTIEGRGPDCTDFKRGDSVYGSTEAISGNIRSFSQYIAIESSHVTKIPSSLTKKEAAALPYVTITAWTALIDKMKIQKGENILIHGGTGAVGYIAIQIAVEIGAKVFSTVPGNAEAKVVTELGAIPIFYKNESPKHYMQHCTDGKGFDAVFDTIGGKTLKDSLFAATADGRVTTIHSNPESDALSLLKEEHPSKQVFFLPAALQVTNQDRNIEILNEMSTWASEGIIKPLIAEKSFRLKDASKAHKFFKKSSTLGKVVIEIK